MNKKFLLTSLLSFSLIACTGNDFTDISSTENSSLEGSSSVLVSSTDSSSVPNSSFDSSLPESSPKDVSSQDEVSSIESSQESSTTPAEPIYAPLTNSFLKTIAHNKMSISATGDIKTTIQIKIKTKYGATTINNTETISLQLKNFNMNFGFDFSNLLNPSTYLIGAELSGDFYTKTKLASEGITLSEDSSTTPFAINSYLYDDDAYIDLSQSHLSSVASMFIDEEIPFLRQKTCFQNILLDFGIDIDNPLPSFDPTSISASCDLIDQSISWDNFSSTDDIDTYTKDIDKDNITDFCEKVKDALLPEDLDLSDFSLPEIDFSNFDFSDIDLSNLGLEDIDLSAYGLGNIDISNVSMEDIRNILNNAIFDNTIDLGINNEGIKTFGIDSLIKSSTTVTSTEKINGITMDQETKTTVTMMPDIEFTLSYDDDVNIPTPQDTDSYTIYNFESFIEDIKEAIENNQD